MPRLKVRGGAVEILRAEREDFISTYSNYEYYSCTVRNTVSPSFGESTYNYYVYVHVVVCSSAAAGGHTVQLDGRPRRDGGDSCVRGRMSGRPAQNKGLLIRSTN